jgi:isopenicillin N synthase-like dioxygenase
MSACPFHKMSANNNLVKFAVVTGVVLGALAAYNYLSKKEEKDTLQYTRRPSIVPSEKKPIEQKSNALLNIPTIDFSKFFNKEKDPKSYEEECKKVAFCLHNYGIVIIKDPRVFEQDNETFINLMEQYFESSDGIRDARPEFHYQVGVTGEKIEKPRNHCTRMGAMGPDDKPLSPCPPEKDPKWRFFWRIGDVPPTTEFPALNMDPVIPPDFPEWTSVMNMWGTKMMQACFTLAEMAAIGFDMPSDSFTSRMKYGPHLLAPTGSDFNKYNAVGTVLAGFHYDLNFLTIHGKSRFPGLNAWTREGKKVGVAVPDGCLIVQAGKQIEYLTGGHVLAGFHEVIVTDATRAVIDRKKAAGESLWRVSSTLFSQIASDQLLFPLPPFNTPNAIVDFPPIKCGHQVQHELEMISLAKTD